MKQLIELSLYGDDYFFLDELSDTQYEQLLLLSKKRFGKHPVGACQIDAFIAEVQQVYSIPLERAIISRVIAF